MYGSETMLWMEKERSRAVQMNNLRGLLGIRRKDRVPNARIRELCGVKNDCYGGSGMWRGWRMIGLPRDSM